MQSSLLVVGVISHLWCAARLVGIAHHSFYSVVQKIVQLFLLPPLLFRLHTLPLWKWFFIFFATFAIPSHRFCGHRPLNSKGNCGLQKCLHCGVVAIATFHLLVTATKSELAELTSRTEGNLQCVHTFHGHTVTK